MIKKAAINYQLNLQYINIYYYQMTQCGKFNISDISFWFANILDSC